MMPIPPTTAAEIERTMERWRQRNDAMMHALHARFAPLQENILAAIFPPPAPPRPRTDDIVQMLDDLGIEPPARHPQDWRDLTFTWRN
jgi:hypothetical protein